MPDGHRRVADRLRPRRVRQRQHRGSCHQRQHRGHRQAGNNGLREGHPEAGELAAVDDGAVDEVHREVARQRQQPENRGRRRQQHRTQTLRRGTHHEGQRRRLRIGAAVVVVGVDEHDVVVHHDSGQRHHANPRQDGAERAAGDQQAEQHARRGHHHRHQDEKALVEAVELRHQQHEHQQQRHAHCRQNEGDGVRLLFVGAAKRDGDARIEFDAFQPRADLPHLVVGKHARGHFGADEAHRPPADALDGVHIGRRAAAHEVADGHQAARRRHPQFVQRINAPRRRRIADADVHRVVRRIRPVFAHLHAAGHQLHGDAHQRDVGAVQRRLGAIHGEAPLHAGQRPRILHIAQTPHIGVHVYANAGDHRIQQALVHGGELDLDGLAHRRALVHCPHLHHDAGEIRRLGARALQDLPAAQAPLGAVVQLQEHQAHGVRGSGQLAPAGAATRALRLRVHALDARNGEDAVLHLAHQRVDLLGGEIAAGADGHPGVGGVAVREERHAAPELAVGGEGAHQHQRGDKHGDSGAPASHVEHARVPAGEAAQRPRVAVLQRHKRSPRAFVPRRRLAEARADGWSEHQRVQQRPGEHEKHRDGQVAHELAGDPRPEHQWQKRRQGGGDGRGDRPEHARCGRRVGVPRRHALRHLPVRVLGDHDGAVDQHAEAKQHPEHDHEVEGVAEQPHERQREQEGDRDGHADDDAAAQADGGHHQHHHHHQRGDDVALQLGHLVSGEGRLVLGREQPHGGRQMASVAFDHGAHFVHRAHQVGAGAFAHVDGDGVRAVHPGMALPILEGAPNVRHVGKRHHGVRPRLQGQIEDVLGGLDDAGHLHRHAPGAGLQRAGGDELVVARHGGEQLLASHLVRFQLGRIDHHLEHLFAVPLQLRVQHVRKRFDVVAQGLRGVVDNAFRGAFAHQVDLHDGKVGGRLFDDEGLFRGARKLRFGPVHRGAHVRQRLIKVVIGFELDDDPRRALVGHGAHLFAAFHRAQFGFQRLGQQTLGVFRRDALVGHHHHEHRHVDLRRGFDGHERARHDAGDQHHQHEQQRRARAIHRRADENVVHVPSATAPRAAAALALAASG